MDNTIRPEVMRFAGKMEMRLRENEHRGGWGNLGIVTMLNRILKQADNIVAEVEKDDPQEAWISTSAVDAANYAMMIDDLATSTKDFADDLKVTSEGEKER